MKNPLRDKKQPHVYVICHSCEQPVKDTESGIAYSIIVRVSGGREIRDIVHCGNCLTEDERAFLERYRATFDEGDAK